MGHGDGVSRCSLAFMTVFGMYTGTTGVLAYSYFEKNC